MRPMKSRSSRTASGWLTSSASATRACRSTRPSLTGTTASPAARRQGVELRDLRDPLAGVRRRSRRGAACWCPIGREKVADVVAIPDADQTPEQIVGLAPGVPPESQYARRLAESGCRVIVPTLIDRRLDSRNGRAKLTEPRVPLPLGLRAGPAPDRLRGAEGARGRRLVRQATPRTPTRTDRRVRLGRRRDARAVRGGAGHADRRRLRQRLLRRRARTSGKQPIDRNVFGLLEQFGDAELASLIAPRTLVRRGRQGTRGRRRTRQRRRPRQAHDARRFKPSTTSTCETLGWWSIWSLSRAPRSVISADLAPGSPAAVRAFVNVARSVGQGVGRRSSALAREPPCPTPRPGRPADPRDRPAQPATADRKPVRPQGVFTKLDTARSRRCQKRSSRTASISRRGDRPVRRSPAAAERPLAEGLRRAEVHGLRGRDGRLPRRDRLRDPARAQGDQAGRAPAGGRLPARAGGAAAGRRRSQGEQQSYHQFAVRLAERGFVTFAPQNLYLFHDRFRTLAAEGEPAQEDALLGDRAAAPADRRLAQDARRRSTRSGSPSTGCRTAASRRCGFRRW